MDVRLRLALLFYGGMTAAAWGVVHGFGDGHLFHRPEAWLSDQPWALRYSVSLALGLALGVLTVWMSRVVVRRYAWAQFLENEFRARLGAVDARTIMGLALTSSIGEEILFRGALQPWLGLPLTSVLFGGLHFGPDRRFLAWTLWAILMGFAFGGIYEVTGVLAGPIVAHAWINWRNLAFFDAHKNSGQPPFEAKKR